MKKVCFAGLASDKNLGDVVILKSTEGLYINALSGRVNFESHRLDLKCENRKLMFRMSGFAKGFVNKFFRVDDVRYRVEECKKYYKSVVNSVDLIVVVGGGLIKYKYQYFYIYLAALIELAEELEVPLIINAAGIEGYNQSDRRCQLLKRSLNSPVVKSITTRDDFKVLSQNYMRAESSTHVGKVADSAICCNLIYGMEKQPSEVFGIGLVRGGIFLDNERDLPPEKVVNLYVELITEMEARNLKYQLFTNGLPSDAELLPQIEAQLGREELTVIEPSNDEELISTIASFGTVIAARLHANIISYSLDIPSVGLVWNDKLSFFAEEIGHPNRFFDYDQLHATKIVEAAVLARQQGYDLQRKNDHLNAVKQNIESLVEKWLAHTL